MLAEESSAKAGLCALRVIRSSCIVRSLTRSLAPRASLSLLVSFSLNVNRRRFLRFSLLPSVFHARRRCDGAVLTVPSVRRQGQRHGENNGYQWSEDTIMDHCCSSAICWTGVNNRRSDRGSDRESFSNAFSPSPAECRGDLYDDPRKF